MASQSTVDKLYNMRLSVMAQAYRDQGELPGAAGMTFDERFAMVVDAEWNAHRVNKRTRLLRQQFSPAGWHSKLDEGAIADAVIDRIVYRSEVIRIEGDEPMRKRIG